MYAADDRFSVSPSQRIHLPDTHIPGVGGEFATGSPSEMEERAGSWGSPAGWAGGGCWAREQEVFVALWGLSRGQAGIPKSLE